ncbi:MAG TPA: pitrilysin family protein [Pyrinomonadaceae bacterium]|nr:pitrilysin family protein [Pyrinomonadaceae bacterium]
MSKQRNMSKRFLALFLAACTLAFAPATQMSAAPAATQAARGAAVRPSPAKPATQTAPQGAKGAAATAPAPQFQAAQLANKLLANGLEVIVLEDHSVPLVTVELAVKNGSYTEPPELNGLSHLYEHMFFKENRATRERADYLQSIDQLGVTYNGTTREEIVNYYFTTISPNYPVAMRFLRDAVRYPSFNERQFEQEREVVINELERNNSNPFGALSDEMNNRLFYKYPSRKQPGGNKETVRTATTDMMRLIQGRYYVPNNSAIVVTGDVRAAEVFRLAEELFGDWERRAKDPFVEFPPVEHPPLAKSESAILRQPVQNVIIEIGWQGPSIGKDDASTYAADVFSFILRQPDSRFQRALVDTGLVTVADLGYYTQRNVGPIQLIAQTTPDKARAALRAIYKEMDAFNEPGYFTDEQLESAKGLLEADDLYSREKTDEYTHTISFWWASTGLDYFRGYLGNLRRTSRADINRYVTTYIQGKPHVGLALLSDESQKQAQITPQDLIGQ